MDGKECRLKNLQAKTNDIQKMLRKGSDVLVFQLGSHSYKFNFAKQKHPHKILNLIAYKKKMKNRQTQPINEEKNKYQQYDIQINKLENQLRDKGVIREGKAAKGKPKTIVECKLKECGQKEKDIYFDEQIFWVQNNPQYKVIQPIKHGYMNISQTQSIHSICEHIQKILIHGLKEKLKLTTSILQQMNAVLIIPDSFQRLQVKSLVSMFLNSLNFKAIYLHLQSVLSTFRFVSLSHCCLVDIGYEKTSVACLNQGIILANTVIRKNFGSRDLDQGLLRLINQKSINKNKMKLSILNKGDLNQIQKLKQKGCSFEYEQAANKLYSIKYVRQNNSEQIIIQQPDYLFIIPWILIHQSPLKSLPKKENKQFDYNSEYFQLYYDPEDYFEEFSGGGNPYPHSTALQFQKFNQQMINPFIFKSIPQMICYSISNLKQMQLKKKFASNILLTGGGSMINKMPEILQIAILDQFKQYNQNINKVEFVQMKDNSPISLSWSGGTIIPNLEPMKDLWIARGKFVGDMLDRVQEQQGEKKGKKQIKKEWGMKYLKQRIPFPW